MREDYREVIRDAIVGVVDSSIAKTSLYLFIQVGLIGALLIGSSAVILWTTPHHHRQTSNQLISLLYFIPQLERDKIQDINSFIESGGAMVANA